MPIESLYATLFPVIAKYLSNYCFDEEVPLFNALVLGNLFEYRHKSYTAKKVDSFGYIVVAIVADNMGLPSTNLK